MRRSSGCNGGSKCAKPGRCASKGRGTNGSIAIICSHSRLPPSVASRHLPLKGGEWKRAGRSLHNKLLVTWGSRFSRVRQHSLDSDEGSSSALPPCGGDVAKRQRGASGKIPPPIMIIGARCRACVVLSHAGRGRFLHDLCRALPLPLRERIRRPGRHPAFTAGCPESADGATKTISVGGMLKIVTKKASWCI